MSSHRVQKILDSFKRRMSPRAADELRYLTDHFSRSVYSRDLSGIEYSIYEISKLLRGFHIPTDLVEEYTSNLWREVYIAREKGIITSSIAQDIRHLLVSRIQSITRKQKAIREKRKKEEAKKVLDTKLKKIAKIKITPEQPVLFFLGAGASKPAPSSIPTVSEMLGELWKKSTKMENKPLAKLEAWCKENQIDNIEEMLTGVTLSDFMIRNRKVHNLLNSVLYPEWGSLKELSIRDVESVTSFRNLIDTFFSLLVGTMLNAPPNSIHEAIANFIGSFGNTKIVTTNYDVCMDEALDKAKIEYSYIIGSQKNHDAIPLAKMHGSINWFYCRTCQHVLMPTVENMRIATKNDVPYSITGMCPVCTAPTKQFIVPPTTYKFLIYPPIVQVWNAGREIFENSKFYVIIGYSFSLGDDYISKMLLKAIREDPTKQLIIIDKSEETIGRFKDYVRTHTLRFEEKNFHGFIGPAEDIAPKVINALVKKKKIKKSKKKATQS